MHAELEPGRVIAGDFRVERLLATGGMGAVYVVEQISTGRRRALKVLRPSLAADPSFVQRFTLEAKVGGRIASEHVVEVVGAGVDAATGAPYLAMELLEGAALDAIVARRRLLPLAEAAEVLAQVGHGLAAAHRASVVHRDLKPENVFVGIGRSHGQGVTVKLLDFGIAKLCAEAGGSQSSSMGTPLWMAPEQTHTRGQITPSTDVFAYGLLAFYVLTGRPFWLAGAPGHDQSIAHLLTELTSLPIPPASERAREFGVGHLVPAGFDAWFAGAVAREPERRFPDAAVAAAELERCLGRAARLAGTGRVVVHTGGVSSLGASSGGQLGTGGALGVEATGATVVSGDFAGAPALSAAHAPTALSGSIDPGGLGAPRPEGHFGAPVVGAWGGGPMAGPRTFGATPAALGATVGAPSSNRVGLVLGVLVGLLFVLGAAGAGLYLVQHRASVERRAAPIEAPPPVDPTPPAPAAVLEVRGFEGSYRITEGGDPSGARYSGTALITRHGDGYGIVWSLGSGATYSGSGIAVGDQLAVGWSGGASQGLVVYEPRGSMLVGRWNTGVNPGQINDEVLVGPEGGAGAFRIAQATGGYTGTATLGPGRTPSVRWQTSAGTYDGIGLWADGRSLLAVGFVSAGQRGGVLVYRRRGGDLVGEWAAMGAPGVGRETLSRH